jgi:phage baseplate assembly protein W
MATAPKNQFTDLDLNFAINPITKDVNTLLDETAVKRSLKNLLLTNKYERPFQPGIQSNITKYLFDNFAPLTEARIEKGIRDTIISFEPRVTVHDVVVMGNPDYNRFDITIKFQIKNKPKISEFQFYIERLR